MKALVIVHLSSLDAYTDAFGEQAGARLAYEFYQKIEDFDGPVFIVDQDWPVTGSSGPRRALYRSLQSLTFQKNIYYEHFDEASVEWPAFMEKFREMLKRMGVSHTVIGGIWYDPDLKTGAVTDIYKFFGDVLPSIVDPKIAAVFPEKKRT